MAGSNYITPRMLRSSPTGVAWDTLPKAAGQSTDDVLVELCLQATSEADEHCFQDLRATLNTQVESAPSIRCPLLPDGRLRIQLTRWPVLSITSVTVQSASDFQATPRAVRLGPPPDFRIINPLLGELGTVDPGSSGQGPTAIELAPGYVDRFMGREGYLVSTRYINGWPHAGLTEAVEANAGTLDLDDCTGMAGVACHLSDGVESEWVTVLTTTAAVGAGVATLLAPTQFPHDRGTLVSSLPPITRQAFTHFAIAAALNRGAQAITAPKMPSSVISTGAAAQQDHKDKARAILDHYRAMTY